MVMRYYAFFSLFRLALIEQEKGAIDRPRCDDQGMKHRAPEHVAYIGTADGRRTKPTFVPGRELIGQMRNALPRSAFFINK